MTGVRGGARFLLVSLFVGACLALTVPAFTQSPTDYPPPTPTVTPTDEPTDEPTPTATATPKPRKSPCAQTGIIAKDKFRARTNFNRGDRIVVRGRNKCASAGANVKLYIEVNGTRTLLGRRDADKKGAYTVSGRIPRTTPFGRHKIVIRTGGKTYVSTIDVVPARGSDPSGFAGSAGPLMVGWVALGGIVAAFFIGTRRRARPAVASTGAAPEVPQIDTSSFVPSFNRHRARGGKAAKKKSAPQRKKPAKRPAAKKPTSKGTGAKPKAADTAKKPKPVAKPKAAKPAKRQADPDAVDGPVTPEASTKPKPVRKGRATTDRSKAKRPQTERRSGPPRTRKRDN